MSQEDRPFVHLPVMVDEIVELVGPVPPGLMVDATVGGGGHASAVLDAHPHLRILGLDQDPMAVAAATGRLAPFGERAKVVRSRFDGLRTAVAAERQGSASQGSASQGSAHPPLVAVLFDLGVSSPQLDRAERGFSYRADAPLDMRMDPDRPGDAAELVNTADERTLRTLFVANGEGRFAQRIARAVIAARPVTSTAQLADVVRDAIPAAARRHGGHPARRVFQAVRIAVNAELDVLPIALDDAIDLLAPGGRVLVLAYHSGEDRLVKQRFRQAETGGCVCPPGLPCVCGATPTGRLVRSPKRPSAAEVAANRRAESARLRVLERVAEVAR